MNSRLKSGSNERAAYELISSFGTTGVSLLLALLFCSSTEAQDFNGDGKPDILWYNKATGANAIWLMDGTATKSSTAIQSSTDLNWRIVGTGFFNDDDQRDILWQHQVTGQKSVWLMKGTTYLSSVPIMPDIEPEWKVVGAADFNADKKTDLVWQHDLSGEKAIWLMDGAKLLRGETVDKESGPEWRICATGEFGGGDTPDLVLRHRKSGALKVWIMNGTTVSTNVAIHGIQRPDLDWKLVGAADFNRDGHTDLLWRHTTLGLSAITLMNGLARMREDFLLERNTDWRIATQDLEDSRYRLEANYADRWWAVATNSPVPKINLISNRIVTNGQSFRIRRRMAGALNWGALLETNLSAASYLDTNVAPGQRYEYEVTNNRSEANRDLLSSGVGAAPVEDRGKIVLLVDKFLVARQAAPVNTALRDVIEDLIGDGWTVVRKDVPRHDDRANDAANRTNEKNLAEIKALLRDEYNAGAKGVLIVGHATIPYSGYHKSDGHEDHEGAWPADMYLGDVDGEWTDQGRVLQKTAHPENSNVPGDGKFENDFPPSNLEMFVGRVDFARIPSLRTGNDPTTAEAELVQQYFEKAHRYRVNASPYPVADAGVAYSYFSLEGRSGLDEMIYENALRNFSAFFFDGVGRLFVGDPYLQRTKSYLWGYIGGNGSPSSVNIGVHLLEHSVSDLLDKLNEPPIAFYMAVGSYFGDWNLPNNLMRATLATANYGLAAVWMPPYPSPVRWRFQGMGLGEPIGLGLLSTVNNNPPRLTGNNNRLLAIMGDPTLRLHILTPPSDLRATRRRDSAQLAWNAGQTNSTYFVYRAPSRAGPFNRITDQPVDGTSFIDDRPSKSEPIYMVRALKLVISGCGSYTNLSQGVFVSTR